MSEGTHQVCEAHPGSGLLLRPLALGTGVGAEVSSGSMYLVVHSEGINEGIIWCSLLLACAQTTSLQGWLQRSQLHI